ncbi:MAG: chromosome segregation protein SMC [Clostridia bacterium]|nr:chromosome segregation protein SMC [Clostridia bacterium]
MKLKKLELYGFKSFADRVEMDFESGITGVVGPNGSGKSNISDAVRWVLGEQSPKTLRGGKMEDVIFNGTEKRKKLAWCEVTLVFDNEDHSLPLDFNEIAVTRRVYRNGEAEYMLNRNACRLRDIIELFRDTGIGREGYSLIGQGRIDEILSAKSEDRRHVFEEAAGIVKFKTRKLEAEKRMENTRQNLERVEDIIAELESRLAPLEEQSRVAREYLQLRDELKGLELNMFLARSDRYNQRSAELRDTLDSLASAIAQNEAGVAEVTARRNATQELLAEREEQAANAREGVQTLIRDVEAREGASGVLREHIAAGEREKQRLTAAIESDEAAEKALRDRLADLSDRLKSETSESETAGERLENMTREMTALSETLIEKERQAEELKAQRIDAINRLSDVKSEQARLTAMGGALESRLEALKSEDAALAETLEECRTAVTEAEDRLRAERDGKARLDKALADVQQEIALSGAQFDQKGEQQRALTAERQETASRLRVLEEMQRDYEGYQNSVKQVLLQARRTPDSGVHGVVATLISVPRRLERAIDMVLGGALQNIVVDREEDAKRMIDFLRQGRLGRATFLPISAVQGRTLSREERGALSLPGCIGVASELIAFDPKYRGIVESLLGRTVVAEDLDSGIRIQRAGHHAFRLVTLEGDVMHSGGSMTGGSVTSRVTSLLSREREISEHREKLQNLGERLKTLQDELSALDARRAELKQRRNGLFDENREQEIACAREEAHLRSAREKLLQETDRSARVREETERMLEQLGDIREGLASLETRQAASQESSEDRQTAIAALTAEIAGLREELAARRRVVTDERVVQAARERGLTAMGADVVRMTGEQTDFSRQLDENRQKLAACEQGLNDDNARLKSDSNALAALRQALDGERARFSAIDKQRVEAQQTLKELGESLDRLRADLDAFTEKQHRADMQLSRLEAEFKTLTDRIWEDYELTYAGAEEFRVEDFRLTESEKRIASIRGRIREMGAVNVGAVDEYRQTQERYDQLSAQRDDLARAQLDLAGIIDDLMKKMEAQFRGQFAALNENFKETFANLFGGGRAELQLADEQDVLNCDINVIAQPPGKRLQMLSLLSGGERALTAIAILFAMLKLKPTPFCFLDEIEAALDDANIDNFADYLRTFSRNTQFVVITHRKGTMERCDALYGVAMEEKGVSTMVSVRMSDAAL